MSSIAFYVCGSALDASKLIAVELLSRFSFLGLGEGQALTSTKGSFATLFREYGYVYRNRQMV
jgi:hypothetical protein